MILLAFVSIMAQAQEKSTDQKSRHKSQGLRRIDTKHDSLSQGLKLIYSSPDEDWEDRLDMDLKDLDVTIDAAVSEAMKSVDAALRDMDFDINIPEIEIPEVDVDDIDIPEVDIPAIKIHIPKLDNLDGDFDHDRFDRGSMYRKTDQQMDKEKVKSGTKEKDKDKDKKKGLVKIE